MCPEHGYPTHLTDPSELQFSDILKAVTTECSKRKKCQFWTLGQKSGLGFPIAVPIGMDNTYSRLATFLACFWTLGRLLRPRLLNFGILRAPPAPPERAAASHPG